MRVRRWRLGLLLLCLPFLAEATEGASTTTVIDFTSAGPLRQYLELSLGVAKSYLPLALILAVVFEGVGRAPGESRNFAEVGWRFVVLVFLLANYQRIFGYVIQVTDDIAGKLTPGPVMDDYHQYMDKMYAERDAGDPGKALPGFLGNGTYKPAAGSGWSPSNIFFDALMGIVLLLGKAIVYGMERLSRILTAVFFVLGPLALVAGIPRQSGTASKWFRHFVTVASWPIFSGLLLGVMAAVGKQSVADRNGSDTGYVVTAIVMGLCALATPLLAGWVVGGAAQNVAASGYAGFQNLTGAVTRLSGNVKKLVARRSGSQGGGGGQGAGAGPQGSAQAGGVRGGGGGRVAANPPASGQGASRAGDVGGSGRGAGRVSRNAAGSGQGQGPRQGQGRAGGPSGWAGQVSANAPGASAGAAAANAGAPAAGAGGAASPQGSSGGAGGKRS